MKKFKKALSLYLLITLFIFVFYVLRDVAKIQVFNDRLIYHLVFIVSILLLIPFFALIYRGIFGEDEKQSQ